MVRTLRARGRECVGVDLVASPFTDIVGSIVDPHVVERALAGVDAVVHAATLHKPHVATHGRQAFVDTKLNMTVALLSRDLPQPRRQRNRDRSCHRSRNRSGLS